MQNIPKLAGPAALLALAVPGAGIASGSGQGEVSFKADIVPVLAAECAACHMIGTEPGELSLVPAKAHRQLVDVASVEVPEMMRVAPGKPDESYLVMKLAGTHLDHGGMGEQMPFGGAPIDDATQAKIRNWIAQGAADN